MNRAIAVLIGGASAALMCVSVAHAQTAPTGIPDPSIATSLPPDLATFGGLRPFLAERGITFQLNDIAEVFGNVTGGMRQGIAPDNRLELVIDADLEKLVGWKGASFHANGYQINGPGISRNYVGNILTISNIEAVPSTRLYEAFFQQELADHRLQLRVGQLVADGRFINSVYSGIFLNGTFGWPGLMAADLPSGGPAYPLATPGIRVKYEIDPHLTLMGAVFDGNPAGPGPGDPQRRDPHGLNFRVTDPPLAMLESQISFGGKDGPILPGTLKLGGWEHFGRFADQRLGTDGVPLAAPNSNGMPFQHSHDYGVYASLDQQIAKLGTTEKGKGFNMFARLLVSPSDRNLIDFYVDGGLVFGGIDPARPDDSFGIAAAFAHASPNASAADRDVTAYTGRSYPVRDYEIGIEGTYNAQIVPGWTIQPDIQYIIHPGANIVSPLTPAATTPMRNALVFGIRSTINY